MERNTPRSHFLGGAIQPIRDNYDNNSIQNRFNDPTKNLLYNNMNKEDDQQKSDKDPLSAFNASGIGENNLLYKNDFKYEDGGYGRKFSFEDSLNNRRNILRSLDNSYEHEQRYPDIIKQDDNNMNRFQFGGGMNDLPNQNLNQNNFEFQIDPFTNRDTLGGISALKDRLYMLPEQAQSNQMINQSPNPFVSNNQKMLQNQLIQQQQRQSKYEQQLFTQAQNTGLNLQLPQINQVFQANKIDPQVQLHHHQQQQRSQQHLKNLFKSNNTLNLHDIKQLQLQPKTQHVFKSQQKIIQQSQTQIQNKQPLTLEEIQQLALQQQQQLQQKKQLQMQQQIRGEVQRGQQQPISGPGFSTIQIPNQQLDNQQSTASLAAIRQFQLQQQKESLVINQGDKSQLQQYQELLEKKKVALMQLQDQSQNIMQINTNSQQAIGNMNTPNTMLQNQIIQSQNQQEQRNIGHKLQSEIPIVKKIEIYKPQELQNKQTVEVSLPKDNIQMKLPTLQGNNPNLNAEMMAQMIKQSAQDMQTKEENNEELNLSIQQQIQYFNDNITISQIKNYKDQITQEALKGKINQLAQKPQEKIKNEETLQNGVSVATNHDQSMSVVDNSTIVKKKLMITLPSLKEEPKQDTGIISISIPRPAPNKKMSTNELQQNKVNEQMVVPVIIKSIPNIEQITLSNQLANKIKPVVKIDLSNVNKGIKAIEKEIYNNEQQQQQELIKNNNMTITQKLVQPMNEEINQVIPIKIPQLQVSQNIPQEQPQDQPQEKNEFPSPKQEEPNIRQPIEHVQQNAVNDSLQQFITQNTIQKQLNDENYEDLEMLAQENQQIDNQNDEALEHQYSLQIQKAIFKQRMKQKVSSKTLNFILTDAMNGPIQPNRKYNPIQKNKPPVCKMLSTQEVIQDINISNNNPQNNEQIDKREAESNKVIVNTQEEVILVHSQPSNDSTKAILGKKSYARVIQKCGQIGRVKTNSETKQKSNKSSIKEKTHENEDKDENYSNEANIAQNNEHQEQEQVQNEAIYLQEEESVSEYESKSGEEDQFKSAKESDKQEISNSQEAQEENQEQEDQNQQQDLQNDKSKPKNTMNHEQIINQQSNSSNEDSYSPQAQIELSNNLIASSNNENNQQMTYNVKNSLKINETSGFELQIPDNRFKNNFTLDNIELQRLMLQNKINKIQEQQNIIKEDNNPDSSIAIGKKQVYQEQLEQNYVLSNNQQAIQYQIYNHSKSIINQEQFNNQSTVQQYHQINQQQNKMESTNQQIGPNEQLMPPPNFKPKQQYNTQLQQVDISQIKPNRFQTKNFNQQEGDLQKNIEDAKFPARSNSEMPISKIPLNMEMKNLHTEQQQQQQQFNIYNTDKSTTETGRNINNNQVVNTENKNLGDPQVTPEETYRGESADCRQQRGRDHQYQSQQNISTTLQNQQVYRQQLVTQENTQPDQRVVAQSFDNASTQQNISIGNNIKQEIILNFVVGLDEEKRISNALNNRNQPDIRFQREEQQQLHQTTSQTGAGAAEFINSFLPNLLNANQNNILNKIPNIQTQPSQQQPNNENQYLNILPSLQQKVQEIQNQVTQAIEPTGNLTGQPNFPQPQNDPQPSTEMHPIQSSQMMQQYQFSNQQETQQQLQQQQLQQQQRIVNEQEQQQQIRTAYDANQFQQILKTMLRSTSDPQQAQSLFNDFIKFCDTNHQNKQMYLQYPQNGDPNEQIQMCINYSDEAIKGSLEDINDDKFSQISGMYFNFNQSIYSDMDQDAAIEYQQQLQMQYQQSLQQQMLQQIQNQIEPEQQIAANYVFQQSILPVENQQISQNLKINDKNQDAQIAEKVQEEQYEEQEIIKDESPTTGKQQKGRKPRQKQPKGPEATSKPSKGKGKQNKQNQLQQEESEIQNEKQEPLNEEDDLQNNKQNKRQRGRPKRGQTLQALPAEATKNKEQQLENYSRDLFETNVKFIVEQAQNKVEEIKEPANESHDIYIPKTDLPKSHKSFKSNDSFEKPFNKPKQDMQQLNKRQQKVKSKQQTIPSQNITFQVENQWKDQIKLQTKLNKDENLNLQPIIEEIIEPVKGGMVNTQMNNSPKIINQQTVIKQKSIKSDKSQQISTSRKSRQSQQPKNQQIAQKESNNKLKVNNQSSFDNINIKSLNKQNKIPKLFELNNGKLLKQRQSQKILFVATKLDQDESEYQRSGIKIDAIEMTKLNKQDEPDPVTAYQISGDPSIKQMKELLAKRTNQERRKSSVVLQLEEVPNVPNTINEQISLQKRVKVQEKVDVEEQVVVQQVQNEQIAPQQQQENMIQEPQKIEVPQQKVEPIVEKPKPQEQQIIMKPIVTEQTQNLQNYSINTAIKNRPAVSTDRGGRVCINLNQLNQSTKEQEAEEETVAIRQKEENNNQNLITNITNQFNNFEIGNQQKQQSLEKLVELLQIKQRITASQLELPKELKTNNVVESNNQQLKQNLPQPKQDDDMQLEDLQISILLSTPFLQPKPTIVNQQISNTEHKDINQQQIKQLNIQPINADLQQIQMQQEDCQMKVEENIKENQKEELPKEEKNEVEEVKTLPKRRNRRTVKEKEKEIAEAKKQLDDDVTVSENLESIHQEQEQLKQIQCPKTRKRNNTKQTDQNKKVEAQQSKQKAVKASIESKKPQKISTTSAAPEKLQKKSPGRPKRCASQTNITQPNDEQKEEDNEDNNEEPIEEIQIKDQKVGRKAQNKNAKNAKQGTYSQNFELPAGNNNQYQLVECEKYFSFEAQPYRIYFTFEVQMLMYIHSYLSKNEVIGMLGGRCYESNIKQKYNSTQTVKFLIISKIYPSESSVKNLSTRQVNCEISIEDQVRIQEQMDKDGVRKLAWYHSHPIFDVNPSITDLHTHANWQLEFDRDHQPFFGVIIGPYFKDQEVDNTLFNIFNLKPDYNQQNKSSRRTMQQKLKNQGKAFHYKIIPKIKLKYSMYTDIKKMIKNSAFHKMDRPNLGSIWTNRRGKNRFNFKEKFMLSLKKACNKNIELQDQFDIITQIRNFLKTEEDKIQLDYQLSSVDVVPLTQIMQQIQIQKQKNNEMNIGQEQQLEAGGQIIQQQIEQRQEGEEPYQMLNLDQQQNYSLQLLQLQQQRQQQNLNNSREYFSIGDPKKISKYLFKIEQVLIKEFELSNQINFMQQTYESQKEQQLAQRKLELQGCDETQTQNADVPHLETLRRSRSRSQDNIMIVQQQSPNLLDDNDISYQIQQANEMNDIQIPQNIFETTKSPKKTKGKNKKKNQQANVIFENTDHKMDGNEGIVKGIGQEYKHDTYMFNMDDENQQEENTIEVNMRQLNQRDIDMNSEN